MSWESFPLFPLGRTKQNKTKNRTQTNGWRKEKKGRNFLFIDLNCEASSEIGPGFNKDMDEFLSFPCFSQKNYSLPYPTRKGGGEAYETPKKKKFFFPTLRRQFTCLFRLFQYQSSLAYAYGACHHHVEDILQFLLLLPALDLS